MSDMIATLRILEPHHGIFAYYDGRIDGKRLHSREPNWLDDGAYSLGIASYAIVEGSCALVYDTHISLAHAEAIRAHLTTLGVTTITVVLSHWHKDHIAGNAVFSDCEIIALALTARTLAARTTIIETSNPPISPVVMPNRTIENRLDMSIGSRRVELHRFDIHSADGLVVWLPDDCILFAGDTLEDTVSYIAEPGNIRTHIRELARLRDWPVARILPNHGDPGIIAAGGYGPEIIDANRRYLSRLADPVQLAKAQGRSLRDFLAGESGMAVSYFDPYEAVHRSNLAAVAAVPSTD